MVTFPVSGSTSTSTIWVPIDGPAPRGLTPARPVIGPPVAFWRAAICLKVSCLSASFVWQTTPSRYSTSSMGHSQVRAARSHICRLMSCAVSYDAQPVLNVTPLPPVLEVKPTESVSPTDGLTSSIGIPSTSASCWDTEARVPPISGEPSTSLTLPSGLTIAMALEGPVPWPQNPLATPRPRYGPVSGAL